MARRACLSAAQRQDSEVHAVLSLYYWQPSPRRDAFDRIAKAAAQALSRFLPQPAAEPGQATAHPGSREAG